MTNPDSPAVVRYLFDDRVIEFETTDTQAFDHWHRGKGITVIGDGTPVIDGEGRLGARHVTSARRRELDAA